jgi:hypothetical protein
VSALSLEGVFGHVSALSLARVAQPYFRPQCPLCGDVYNSAGYFSNKGPSGVHAVLRAPRDIADAYPALNIPRASAYRTATMSPHLPSFSDVQLRALLVVGSLVAYQDRDLWLQAGCNERCTLCIVARYNQHDKQRCDPSLATTYAPSAIRRS